MANSNNKLNIKDKFNKLIKKSQELTFLIVGVLIVIIIAWYIINNISFLATGFNSAFNVDIQKNNNNADFNIKGAREAVRE